MAHVWIAMTYWYDDDLYCGHDHRIGVFATDAGARLPVRQWVEEMLARHETSCGCSVRHLITEEWGEGGSTLIIGIPEPVRPPVKYIKEMTEEDHAAENAYYHLAGLNQNITGYVVREEVRS